MLRRATRIVLLAAVAALLAVPGTGSRAAEASPTPPQAENPAHLEAVIETSKGSITIRFFPDKAPRHVAHFVETARKGGFDGTTFFRAIPYAIIQGGDPITKDPKKRALYGTGGLKLLPDEINDIKLLPGAVAAAAIPGPSGDPQPNTSGTQFFITDTWQKANDGKYTVFGRVTAGMDVVREISVMPTNQRGMINDRVEIRSVTVRPVTPTVDELGRLRAHIETEAGEMVWEFLPTAPENARQFINLARSGYYDGATIYRAVKGLLMQGASIEGWPEDSPNRKRSFSSYWTVVDEFTPAVEFDRGIVGMAHGAEKDSATVHFFVLVSRAKHLDGLYTPFARVVSGIEVADAIANMPAGSDERLTNPVRIKRIWFEEK